VGGRDVLVQKIFDLVKKRTVRDVLVFKSEVKVEIEQSCLLFRTRKWPPFSGQYRSTLFRPVVTELDVREKKDPSLPGPLSSKHGGIRVKTSTNDDRGRKVYVEVRVQYALVDSWPSASPPRPSTP
jgi:hypothetical protein